MVQGRTALLQTSATDEQMIIRVVWLYFMEGRTQGEIAEELSTNRLRINRIISEARRSGLVTITLNSRLTSCVELEQVITKEFGLKRAILVPTPNDTDLVPVIIGQAAADYVTQLLNTTDVRGVGVGWGATLRETVRHIPAMKRPDLCVSSVMGGLTSGIEINTFDIASDLARQLSAECAYLAAPIYAGSPESRNAIITQDVFRDAFERIAKNDLIILSVGDLTERSLLMRYGLPRDVHIDDLIAAGAQGDIMAQFINRSGQPIDHPINHRSIALRLEDLRSMPNVMLASGGMNKVDALAAALRSGLCDILVSDEDTARAAMSLAVKWRGDPA